VHLTPIWDGSTSASCPTDHASSQAAAYPEEQPGHPPTPKEENLTRCSLPALLKERVVSVQKLLLRKQLKIGGFNSLERYHTISEG